MASPEHADAGPTGGSGPRSDAGQPSGGDAPATVPDLNSSVHRLANAPGEVSFARDGTTAFWVHHGTWDVLGNPVADGSIWRWSPDSTPSKVVTGQLRAYGIAVDSSSLYWSATSTTTGRAQIMRASRDVGTPVALAEIGGFGTSHIEVDETYVYWSTDAIYRTLKDGTSNAELLVNSGAGTRFMLGPDGIYYYDGRTYSVRRMNRDASGPAVNVCSTIGFAGFSGMINGGLYVADVFTSTSFIVRAVPLGGGVTKTVVNQDTARGLVFPAPVVDADALYWFRSPHDGTSPAELYVAPTTAGLPKLVGTLPADLVNHNGGALMVMGDRLLAAYSGPAGAVFWLPRPAYTP
jgi:hypothetical protein